MKLMTSHRSMEGGNILQSFICIMGPELLPQKQFIKAVKKALIQDTLTQVFGALLLTSLRMQNIQMVMHLLTLTTIQKDKFSAPKC
jgi:hypothetical protein